MSFVLSVAVGHHLGAIFGYWLPLKTNEILCLGNVASMIRN